MKKLLIAILAVAALSYAEDIEQVNYRNFNLDNVTCKAEKRTYSDPYAEFIIIHCDDETHFSTNVNYLARNRCSVKKVVGSDKISYGTYYVKDPNIYESVTDEYGIDISVKRVNIDCLSIYKKFKSKVVGRIRNSEFKCKSNGCYTYYDDGTKVKYNVK
jgi:hypothetical protein